MSRQTRIGPTLARDVSRSRASYEIDAIDDRFSTALVRRAGPSHANVRHSAHVGSPPKSAFARLPPYCHPPAAATAVAVPSPPRCIAMQIQKHMRPLRGARAAAARGRHGRAARERDKTRAAPRALLPRHPPSARWGSAIRKGRYIRRARAGRKICAPPRAQGERSSRGNRADAGTLFILSFFSIFVRKTVDSRERTNVRVNDARGGSDTAPIDVSDRALFRR